MPRIRRAAKQQPICFPNLLTELVNELKASHDAGQPLIEEHVFPKTNAVRVTVIWDKWDAVPDEDRSTLILQAYEQAEGKAFRDRIALAIGFTVPEAVELGLLPFQVITALRPGDAVTLEQCRQAMIEQGASLLIDPAKPQLRFATEEEAEACRQRLIQHLPESEPVWVITKDVARIA
jgi:hypothetical protein